MGEALSGACLCGSIRFTAVPKRREMDVCHCSLCRKWSGGVFMAVPCSDLAIEDETALGVYRASEWGERLFCRTCGSSLVWRLQDGGEHIAVSLQAFDDSSSFVFTEEIFIDEKPALYAFANATAKKTGAEVMAEFSAEQDS